MLRDTLDGQLKPAPDDVKDPRWLARVILTNGHAPGNPAEAAEPAKPPPGEHEENGERFVSMPPPGGVTLNDVEQTYSLLESGSS